MYVFAKIPKSCLQRLNFYVSNYLYAVTVEGSLGGVNTENLEGPFVSRPLIFAKRPFI